MSARIAGGSKVELAIKPCLSIADLVELGPLSRAGWFNAIRDGRITARKLGSRTVVLREDYERFLKGLPIARGARAAA